MLGSRYVVFGGTEHQRLEIQVRGYSYPSAADADDGNWLTCKVSIAVGGFQGEVECSLRTEEFVSLETGLSELLDNPRGMAEFETMEEQLAFHMQGDGRGHFEVRGSLSDQPGVGNRLAWSLMIDHGQLTSILQEVRTIVRSFPVRRRC